MSTPISTYKTINEWIAQESISFSLDSTKTFNDAVDKVITSLDNSVELLGFGEALHGGEEILILRNRLFQRLVETHGYSTIAVESSFPRGRIVNDYVLSRGPESYEAVQDTGFSHGFGKLDANKELVEWMKEYNEEPSHTVKLHFYGFDSPTEMMYSDSPRQVLNFVLDYLTSIDSTSGQRYREHMESLIGKDADWENTEAMMDPSKSIGLSPSANALRIATEELISELNIRRPEWVGKSDESRYMEAMQYARVARQLLNYHAVIAKQSDDRIAKALGLRDAMMADNLAFIVSHERSNGKVFAFAHNSHLKCGMAQWQLGPHALAWWPAGAHLNELLGSRYTVIGSGVGISDANGISKPEEGTLEALLTAVKGPVRIIPTRKGKVLPPPVISSLPARTASTKNPTYFAFTGQSFTDFDWLVVLDSATYTRGGPHI